MVFIRQTTNETVNSGTEGRMRAVHANPLEPLRPASLYNVGVYIRGFVKYRGSAVSQTFNRYLNDEQKTGYNDSNAAFRQDNRPAGNLNSLLWADSTLTSSKFIFCFQPDLITR